MITAHNTSSLQPIGVHIFSIRRYSTTQDRLVSRLARLL